MRGRDMLQQSSPILINEPALQILPTLALMLGLHEAVFVQQLQYWLFYSHHTFEGRKWVYNTLKQWQQQMPYLGERTVQRAINNLKMQRVIEQTTRFNTKTSDQTPWYTINYHVLNKMLVDWDGPEDKGGDKLSPGGVILSPGDDKMTPGGDKMASSNIRIQENTTETTTEEGAAQPPLGAAPAAATDPAPSDKAPKVSEHPAVEAYRSLHDRFPSKAQMKIIAAKNPPLDNWVRAIAKWAERGHNITDIEGQLDWAFEPERMDRRSKGKQGSKQETAPKADEKDLDEMRRWAKEAYPEKFPEPKE